MELTNEKHEILVSWLERYIIPQKNINYNINTSQIRESFMRTYAYGFYLSNDTMNKVILELGYRAAHLTHDPYLCFNISS